MKERPIQNNLTEPQAELPEQPKSALELGKLHFMELYRDHPLYAGCGWSETVIAYIKKRPTKEEWTTLPEEIDGFKIEYRVMGNVIAYGE